MKIENDWKKEAKLTRYKFTNMIWNFKMNLNDRMNLKPRD